MLFYRCDYCFWTAEPGSVCTDDGYALECPRCGRCSWSPVDDDQVLALFDAGDICHCDACNCVHSR